MPRRRVWQIGLRTLFLLMTAVAVWTVYFSNRHTLRTYEEQIASMQPLARELTVEDEELIAVVKLESYWYDENRWEVYLPQEEFRICLATRAIEDNGLGTVVESVSLAPGKHILELENIPIDNGWRVTVKCDGVQVIAADEPKAWYPASGSVGGGNFERSEQLPADQPMVLFRRRFSQPGPGGASRTPAGPADGILLWIEPTGEEPGGP